MAPHSKLPIYKVTYDLLKLVAAFVRNMPRDFKSDLGTELRRECVAVVLLIYRANSAEDKVPHLRKILERLEVVQIMLRLFQDLKLISQPQYAQAVELTNSIGKQANGWKKSYE